jgi:hypothetical protein
MGEFLLHPQGESQRDKRLIDCNEPTLPLALNGFTTPPMPAPNYTGELSSCSSTVAIAAQCDEASDGNGSKHRSGKECASWANSIP